MMPGARLRNGVLIPVPEAFAEGYRAAARGRPEPDFRLHRLVFGERYAFDLSDGWCSHKSGYVTELVDLDGEGTA